MRDQGSLPRCFGWLDICRYSEMNGLGVLGWSEGMGVLS